MTAIRSAIGSVRILARDDQVRIGRSARRRDRAAPLENLHIALAIRRVRTSIS